MKNKFIHKSPDLISATEGDKKGEIDIQWNPVENAISYVIQISSCSANLNWKQFDIISKSSYTISGLKSRRKHYIRVCAANSAGEGPWSSIICKTSS